MIPFSFMGKYGGKNLHNPLIFTIFVYANKGFAYSMSNIRDPDGTLKYLIMYTDFALKVARYFAKKSTEGKLTPEEQAIHEQAISCKDLYPISCVTVDDLEGAGIETDNITRKQMQCLAKKMGDDYHEQLFWHHLVPIAVNQADMVQIDKGDDNDDE